MKRSLTSLNETQSSYFFGLRWKAILMLSFVLLAVNAGLTTMAYNSQIKQFNNTRIASQERNKQELSALLSNSTLYLQQLQSVISNLEGMQEPLRTANATSIKQSFENHWLSMEFEWGLDRIEFYNNTSQALGKWTPLAPNKKLDAQIQSWVKQVNKSETPFNIISCVSGCSQYAVIPQLIRGEKSGVIVLAASLADSIISFKKITGNDIGIITQLKSDHHSPMQRAPILSQWGYQITGLTSTETTQDILRKFSETYTTIESVKTESYIQFNDEFFELNYFPINSNNENLILVLSNITAEKNHINNATKNILIASLLGLIISEIILFALLSSPIRRLQNMTNSLPLLAKGDYTNARDIISTDIAANIMPDEIDLLNDAAITLSYQLEELTRKDATHRDEISEQLETIAHEKAFIEKILDTAQVIILTLDKKGKIFDSNYYGIQLTGFTENELRGKNFIDLHPDDPVVSSSLANLNSMTEITRGNAETFRHETKLSCKNGNVRHIIWIHTSIKNDDNDGPQILSTGLDITERKHIEKQLGWLSDHDPLTELYNRRRFGNELDQACHWAKRHHRQVAILYIDLDNFKDINDTCGHPAGDAILRNVAKALLSATHDVNKITHQFIGRLGGDEFAIAIREANNKNTGLLADQILEAINNVCHTTNSITHRLSCSIGIAILPDKESNTAELLSNANYAMHQAKLLGRNCYHIFSEDEKQREHSQHRIIWRDKIERALTEERFILYFQPILNIQKQTISHYEVLIRMLDENNEIILPNAFIGIAEDLGLIHAIDFFVLKTAMYKQADLDKQGHDITLAINLSGKAFDDDNLATNIETVLLNSGARAEKLIFEITETAAVSDISAAGRIMDKIKSLGCHFALDDFGVGFSSFYYLKELPVDYVKIDGSFINDLPNSPGNQVLVKALSEVAIGFNKLTVAEFVDSLETLKILHKSKVHFAQGYFIGKPSPNIPVATPDFSSHESTSHFGLH
ncbi:MAG: EAL domain-containing protein [Gammaproteobacteria bacterium]|nr:EAL domain-containing protein [Gammaproteobacteria bacterium]